MSGYLVDGEYDPDDLPSTLTRVTVFVDARIATVLNALGPGAILTTAVARNDGRFAVVVNPDDEDLLPEGGAR